DQFRRPGEAELHGRQQRVAASQELGVRILAEHVDRLPQRLRTLVREAVHRSSPLSLQAAISYYSVEHDLFGKPVSTFPDHAPSFTPRAARPGPISAKRPTRLAASPASRPLRCRWRP